MCFEYVILFRLDTLFYLCLLCKCEWFHTPCIHVTHFCPWKFWWWMLSPTLSSLQYHQQINIFLWFLRPAFEDPVTLQHYHKHPYDKCSILSVSSVNLVLFVSMLKKIQVFCDFRLLRVNFGRHSGRVAASMFKSEQKRKGPRATNNVFMGLISFRCYVLIL